MIRSLCFRPVRAALLVAALSTVAVGAQARSDIGWAVGAGVAVGLLAAGGATYVQAYPNYAPTYRTYPAPIYNTVPVVPAYNGQVYAPPLYSNMPPQVPYGTSYYDQPYVAPRPVYVQPPPVYYAPPPVYINNTRGYHDRGYYDGGQRSGNWRNEGGYRHDYRHDHRR